MKPGLLDKVGVEGVEPSFPSPSIPLTHQDTSVSLETVGHKLEIVSLLGRIPTFKERCAFIFNKWAAIPGVHLAGRRTGSTGHLSLSQPKLQTVF